MSITLDQLSIGQFAMVERTDTDVRIGRRLRELGILRGEAVALVGVAPLGDPVAVQALDTRIALRRELAARIQVCISISNAASASSKQAHTAFPS